MSGSQGILVASRKSVAAVASVLSLSPHSNWRADYGIAVSGSNVVSWTDRVASRVLSEAAPNGPLFVAAHASMNNQPAMTFNTTAHRLASTLAASSWKWLHDGSIGVTSYIAYHQAVITSHTYLLSTVTNVSQNPGFVMNVYNGVASGIRYADAGWIQAGANGGQTVGKRWLASRFYSGSPSAMSTRANSSTLWTMTGTHAPSANNPVATLNLQPRTGAVSVVEILLFDRVLNDAEHSLVSDYFTAQYGAF